MRFWSRLYAKEKAIWPNGKGRTSVDFASFGLSVSFSADGKRLFVGTEIGEGPTLMIFQAEFIFSSQVGRFNSY